MRQTLRKLAPTMLWWAWYMVMVVFCAFMLSTAMSCGGTKPPKPPVPSQPVCGNGACETGESPESCPGDCKAPEPPQPVCGDNKCEGDETPANCSQDCKEPERCGDGMCSEAEKESGSCPRDCPPPVEPDKVLDKTRLVIYGQYVQFNQPGIDWMEVAKNLYENGYNAISVHGQSEWGGYPTMMSWVLEGDRYNLDKQNDAYFDNVERFADAMGHYDITIEWCFYDRYFESKWGAMNRHPFCQNNKGFNWCSDARPLYESWNKTGGSNPPDSAFAWVKWTTNGKDGYQERVIAKKYVHGAGPALEKMQDRVIGIFVKAKQKHPGMDKMLIRFSNENEVIYRTDGSHVVFGGESKLYEIIQMEFEEAGWKNGREFQMVDDGTPLDVVVENGKGNLYINLKQLAKQQGYLRMMGWLQELHNMDERKINDVLNYAKGTALQMDSKRIIFSTDGMKPEDASFVPKCQKVYKMKLPFSDFKVPSELSPQKNLDFMYCFLNVQPVMKKITGR